jgi:hypothetical protein
LTLEPEIGTRIVEQMLEMHIGPEVRRRQAAGSISKPYILTQAQVVFFPDGRPTAVRLNDEIEGFAQIRYREGYNAGSGNPATPADIVSIDAFRLDSTIDPDCGHVTIIGTATGLFTCFDFRYNSDLARRHLAAAKEFLEAARYSLEKSHHSALIDNLFSACELAAKASLLSHADRELRDKTNHKAIKSRFNRDAHLGNANTEHTGAFNRLSKLRGSARYLDGDHEIDAQTGHELMEAVSDFVSSVEAYFNV